ncbi:27835_t:CDS:2, partial [Racocetra persica]
LSSRSVDQPPGPLWQAFNPIKTNDKKPKAHCIFCNLNKPISDANRSNQLLLEGIVEDDAPLSLV